MKKEIQLTNGPVSIRPYRLSDVDRQNEAARESVAELSVWLPWCHADYSIEESRTWVESRAEAWENGAEYDFTIIGSGDDSFLGGCGLNNINRDYRIANLGYWVRTSRTREGIATTATLLLARFGFDALKLNRIEIVCAVGNKTSQRVAEKAGATREGILRNRIAVRDKIHDAVIFSLIPEGLVRKSRRR